MGQKDGLSCGLRSMVDLPTPVAVAVRLGDLFPSTGQALEKPREVLRRGKWRHRASREEEPFQSIYPANGALSNPAGGIQRRVP